MAAVEIQTPVAFIQGNIEVTSSIPPSCQDRVNISAQSGNSTAATGMDALSASKSPREYSLTVAPGTWQVWAQLGPVMSEKHTVTVAAGEAQEVDFSFGKDPD
jgi:hypothetical protein